MLRVFKVRVVDLSRSLPGGSLLTEFRGVAEPTVWSHLPRGGTPAPGPPEPRMAVSKVGRNQENPELWVQVLPQLLYGVAECGPGARPGPSTGGVSVLGRGGGCLPQGQLQGGQHSGSGKGSCVTFEHFLRSHSQTQAQPPL